MIVAAKRGRPRKAKSERAPTVNFTMRLRPSLLEELRQSAAKNERSITAEAESRLSQPPTNDIGRMVGLVVDTVERRTGKSSSTDQETRVQCAGAILAMHQLLFGISMPPRERVEQALRYTNEEHARAVKEGDRERAEMLDSSGAAFRSQLDAIEALGGGVRQ